MKIGLFIPCYINQYYPRVGMATYRLLRNLGFKVEYPMGQTCCGQPLGNSGYERYATQGIDHFNGTFRDYDIIVAPSGSCVHFVKEHPGFDSGSGWEIMELSEFLIEMTALEKLKISFRKKVGVLQSCHGLRGLKLGKSSELMQRGASTIVRILKQVKDVRLVQLKRPDECCGFGGTFSVREAELSVKMGEDRLYDFINSGAEVITGTDVSCLMHLEGLILKRKLHLEVKHFSEILMPV
ncbi:MAG: (Fe-S)-binding protein [Cytophagales bacterium]|nr:(Fe-S)-binding protein [Cytophagales bacterium]